MVDSNIWNHFTECKMRFGLFKNNITCKLFAYLVIFFNRKAKILENVSAIEILNEEKNIVFSYLLI